MLQTGHYAFYRSRNTTEHIGSFRFFLQDLLMQGFQRIDEVGYFREKIRDGSEVFVAIHQHSSEHDLTPLEQLVLKQIDGSRTLDMIGRLTHIGEFDVTKAAFGLMQAGIIRRRSTTLPPPSETSDTEVAHFDEVISVFNGLLAKLYRDLQGQGRGAEMTESLSEFTNADPVRQKLFDGVRILGDGTLDIAALMKNILAMDSENHARFVWETLNGLIFFAMFLAGETMDEETGEHLQTSLDRVLGFASDRST
jgi:hypothetical protein